MIKVLFALLLVGICFVLYLMTLEFRDINKRVHQLESNFIQDVKDILDYRKEVNNITNMHDALSQRFIKIENDVTRIKIEQRKAMNQSVYDNDFVDIEQLKKEVEEYDEEN